MNDSTVFYDLNCGKQRLSMVNVDIPFKKTAGELHFFIAFSFPVTLWCIYGQHWFISGNGRTVQVPKQNFLDRKFVRSRETEARMTFTGTQNTTEEDGTEPPSLGAARVKQFRKKQGLAGVKRVEVNVGPDMAEIAAQVAETPMAIQRHKANTKPGLGVGVRCLSEIAAKLWPCLRTEVETDGLLDESLNSLLSSVIMNRRSLIEETGLMPPDIDRLLIMAIERERLMARSSIQHAIPRSTEE